MTTPQATSDQYRTQAALAASASAVVGSLWRQVGDDFDAGWASVRPQALAVVQRARQAAVASALPYTEAVLAETGQTAEAVGSLVPSRFLVAGTDGQPFASQFDAVTIRAKQQVAAGQTTEQALESSGRWLTATTLTVMADTRRQVYAADIASRPTLTGYVRMLTPPSCSDCVILAGKWFRWNDGFERHRRCDCTHIPASENVAGDFRTDPYEYFNGLSTEEQNRSFGKAGAEAIREGGDIYRVVNVRNRGLAGNYGARVYGSPTRLTPNDIFRQAPDRQAAIRMLREEGYITGPQAAGGNIVGRYRERFAAPISQPVIAGSARDRVLTARATGVRDPLDRATMTSAERRIYDLHERIEAGRRGVWLRSIGQNSADLNTPPMAITAIQMDRLLREYDAATNAILSRPDRYRGTSLWRLLEALGVV